MMLREMDLVETLASRRRTWPSHAPTRHLNRQLGLARSINGVPVERSASSS
jgi:hypothetical protein